MRVACARGRRAPGVPAAVCTQFFRKLAATESVSAEKALPEDGFSGPPVDHDGTTQTDDWREEL